MSTLSLHRFINRYGYRLSVRQRGRIGMRDRYPVVWIEEIRQLTGQQEDPKGDWLARYLEGPDGTNRSR